MDLRTSNYAIEPSLDYCACYEGLYTVTCTLYCACTPALSVWPPGDGWGDARPLDSPWMENLCTTHKEGSARFMRGRLANIPRSVWLYVCVWLGVCVVACSIQITAIFQNYVLNVSEIQEKYLSVKVEFKKVDKAFIGNIYQSTLRYYD